MKRVTKVYKKVGWCAQCKANAKTGDTYDPEKFYNCNRCGYYHNYSDELIEYDPKTLVITFSSVR